MLFGRPCGESFLHNTGTARCGGTTFVIGKLFDRSNLIDPMCITDPVVRIEHLFDYFGMLRASNDPFMDRNHGPEAPANRH